MGGLAELPEELLHLGQGEEGGLAVAWRREGHHQGPQGLAPGNLTGGSDGDGSLYQLYHMNQT